MFTKIVISCLPPAICESVDDTTWTGENKKADISLVKKKSAGEN